MSKFSSIAALFRTFSDIFPTHWLRRKGTLGPAPVFLILMFMSVLGSKGYRRTMEQLKEQLGYFLGWDYAPSAPSLCEARRKLDATLCNQVMREVYRLCSTARKYAKSGYADMRVLAADGTHLILPAYREIREHFGCPRNGSKKEQLGPQASLTVLWDVGANQPVDWRLGPYREHERVHALELIESLGPGDLLLADRGFPSRRMLTALYERRVHFLMRIRCDKAGSLREVSEFARSGRDEALVTLLGRKPGEEPITVRLLRMVLSDNSVAVFVTSLCDRKKHPAEVLLKLFAKRWRIETAFKEMKWWHGLQNFHARHVDGIAQEVCAVMVFQLLASEVQARAEKEFAIGAHAPPDDPPIRFNRQIVADCTAKLILAGLKGKAEVERVFENAMFELWRYRQRVRPGRSFARERKSSLPGWRPRGSKGKGYA